jgi:hypothetical protein
MKSLSNKQRTFHLLLILVARIAILVSMVTLLGCDGDNPKSEMAKSVVPSQPKGSEPTLEVAESEWEAAIEPSEPPITVEPPSGSHPVTAAIVCHRFSDTANGRFFDVWIKLMIATGHHVYAPTTQAETFQPLSVDMSSESGLVGVGDWTFPPPMQLNGSAVYVESVLLHRRFRSTVDADARIQATIRYQVCNEDVCFPPATIVRDISIDHPTNHQPE